MQGIRNMTEPPEASYRTVGSILRLDTGWPDPEPCCGRFYCKLKVRDKCWEATGEVQIVYLNHFIGPINDITFDIQENLGKNLSYRPIFSHNIYMVGQKKRKSNPIIFFCCEEESARTRARNIVASSCEISKILKKYPAIHLGDMSFAPECSATPDIPARSADAGLWIHEEYSSSRRVFIKPGFPSPGKDYPGVGVPVIFARNEHNESREATIGGFISLGNGTIYGLTTAHGFQKNDYEVVKSKAPQVRKFDYEMDPSDTSDSEQSQSDESEDDEAFIDRTSQLTLSPTFASSQARPQTDLNTPTTDTAGGSGSGLGPDDCLFGEVAYTSMEKDSLGLDWALIEVTYDRLHTINFIDPSERKISTISNTQDLSIGNGATITIRDVEPPLSPPLPGPRQVLAVTGGSGVLSGIISGTSTSILLPGSSKMQEVWNVHLHGAIQEGDCGSLVIDERSGHVYGHIVAGVIGTGFVYIVPAYKVQLDIQRRSGKSFSFSTTEEYKQSFVSESQQWPYDFVFVKDQDNISEDDPEGSEVRSTTTLDVTTSLSGLPPVGAAASASTAKKTSEVGSSLTSRVFASKMKRWPNPELSIGKPIPPSSMPGRLQFWEVTGPAMEVWTAIRPRLSQFLDSIADLNATRRSHVTFSMFMVGKTINSASPTIIIQSASTEPRKRVVNLVENSSILDAYPGVVLADASKLPGWEPFINLI